MNIPTANIEKKHLDSEYKNRWELFYLDNGSVEDSREKNWRDVAWNHVVKVEIHMKGKVYSVDNSGEGFKFFLNFRRYGFVSKYNKFREYVGKKKINTWIIGWTNGKECFLKEVDFYSGKLVKEFSTSLCHQIGHIHPDVADLVEIRFVGN